MLEELLEKNEFHRILLIDPAFPIANKSRNHKDLLPVGLLKISSYLKSKGIETKLIRLNNNNDFKNEIIDFNPNFVLITSVFTYWFNEVKEAVNLSKELLPNVDVMVGGILASLVDDLQAEGIKCDYVHKGVVNGAEHMPPDYSILENGGEDIDFQIIHSTRGCKRNCSFCGVNKIEKHGFSVSSIEKELIGKKNLVFYDNNLLENPNIVELLQELIKLRGEKKISKCESQSGFDGRMLHKNKDLANLLKKANFKDPKIAWDGPFKAYKRREREISILESGGYKRKEIAVFMLYNHELEYEELEKKRALCFKWGVQVSDCRFRPLNMFYDGYNPHKRSQSKGEYYIHENWTDEEVRQFRRNVRRHNICIRHNMDYHSRKAEIKKISKDESMYIRNATAKWAMATGIIDDAWDPSKPHKI
ncbi:cobalamin-dependent protein [uncultured Methanobrevibacter sp.]|uniref:cobalamin-dependent protein n=1 Tax=uncultured Methanobrevibacter sp. TaxID=253161 RepID=UPI0025D82D42|nr:cobalamin-dependent protein [uncultured Methanobrevibacter sp.]